LFGSAVAYYARYRPGYPQDLEDAVAARAGLDGTLHWTDRPPGGTAVVANDVLGDGEQPDWVRAITRIRARYLGARRRAAPGRASTVTAMSWPAVHETVAAAQRISVPDGFRMGDV
jgi:membrane protein required for beta-lactamase induction